jgi:hypothetical protein
MLIKIIVLHSEEAMVLLASLSRRISQDLNKVLDSPLWERHDKVLVQLNNIEIKLNL